MIRRTPAASVVLVLILLVAAAGGIAPVAHAQGNVFPLPAPLYILTSEQVVLHMDPRTGGQAGVSPIDQPVTDFDIAPDGEWYVYRTHANNAAVVSRLTGMGGYVLEFDVSVPAQSSAAQTIAWSPDAARIAYITDQGVRVAELGQGPSGENVFSTIGGTFAELYWLDGQTIIASDAYGGLTRISGSAGQWTLEAATGLPMRAQPVVPSFLAAQGVMLSNSSAIPSTAGALAFDWGPIPAQVVAGRVMPADVAFLSPDAAGVAQVWRLPANGAPAAAVTASPAPVLGYAFAPGYGRIAYGTADRLSVAALDGSAPRDLAMLDLDGGRIPTLAWSLDGSQIAYSDARGLWIAAADGSAPPRLMLQNTPFGANVSPADVRTYILPVWSPDGSRLLLSAGFWESMNLGLVDVTSGALAVVPLSNAALSQWTPDGQIVAYSLPMGSPLSSLMLVDPAAPDAPLTLFTTVTRTADLAPDGAGGWEALIAPSAQIGPQFWRAMRASQLGQPFAPLYADPPVGVFMEMPVVLPAVPGSGDPVWAAGLRDVNNDVMGVQRGTLVIADMSSGTVVQIQTSGPANDVRWLR